jgi:GT2 family glycosyltransferase
MAADRRRDGVEASVVLVSKDEPALSITLTELQRQAAEAPVPVELLVIDASSGRLATVAERHPQVRWIDFAAPPGAATTIAHQRNVGVAAARGATIVFIDAGCTPHPNWLTELLAPIIDDGELVVAGAESSSITAAEERAGRQYVAQAPTLNLAVARPVVAAIGGFDETFAYGSDLDFSWRATDAGIRIRLAPAAVVTHDWGGLVRQAQRGLRYGRAKARLYAKHPRRLRGAWRTDPMTLVYPPFVLWLLCARRRARPLALLAVPLWRNRRRRPVVTVVHHLAFGIGVLDGLTRQPLVAVLQYDKRWHESAGRRGSGGS